MAVKKVWIEDGCTSCESCVEICPEVFRMEDIAVVIGGVDFDDFEEEIIEAADCCPSEVIKYE